MALPSVIDFQHIEVLRLSMFLMRNIARAYFNNQANFGAIAGDVMLCMAIYLGQAERKPLSAAKLAQYVGIPRPTVVRRLLALERQGYVERYNGYYILPADRVHTDECLANLDLSVRIIHKVSRNLSNLDIKPIAEKKGTS